MSDRYITERLMSHSKDIAALWENTKSAHKRLDENDKIASGIHKLAANVESMALQVKLLTERMDRTIERMESSLRSHGERIGGIESGYRTVERNEQSIVRLSAKIEALEREPATRWKDLVKQLLTLVTAAMVGGMLSGLIG